jgi:hypothetical protein
MSPFARAGFRPVAFAGAVFIAVTLFGTELAHAQEILLTGPLAGAPSLRRTRIRAERVELAVSPGASFGVDDRVSLLAGGEAHYYPWEALGAGAWGTWAFPVGNGDTELRAAVSPELVLVPVSGKANAFEEFFFRFDLHVLAGPTLAFTRRENDDETEWMPMAGIGFRAFCGWSWTKTLDYRILFGDPVRHLVTVTFGYWPVD